MLIDGTTANVPSLARTILMTVDATSGVLTYAIALAAEITKTGAKVHLVSTGPKPRPEQLAAIRAIPRVVLHESAHPIEWMDVPWADVKRAGEWLRDLEDEVRPDIVHLNGPCHGAAGFRAPVIVVVHCCRLSRAEALGDAPGSRFDAYREAAKRGLAAAVAVIAVSQEMRAALDRHYGPISCVGVVPNGLSREPKAWAKDPLVVATGRTWDRAKNVATLTRVARELPWPVKIAGGPAPSGVEAVTLDMGAAEDVGWLPPSAFRELLDRAAIFVLPARYAPFSMATLEAALHGCALVLGDIPSLREVWEGAATFVRPGDERALVDAITKLTEDDALRTRLAAAANLRARLYTPARTARAMLDVYETIIQSRSIPITFVRGHETRSP